MTRRIIRIPTGTSLPTYVQRQLQLTIVMTHFLWQLRWRADVSDEWHAHSADAIRTIVSQNISCHADISTQPPMWVSYTFYVCSHFITHVILCSLFSRLFHCNPMLQNLQVHLLIVVLFITNPFAMLETEFLGTAACWLLRLWPVLLLFFPSRFRTASF